MAQAPTERQDEVASRACASRHTQPAAQLQGCSLTVDDHVQEKYGEFTFDAIEQLEQKIKYGNVMNT